MKAPLILSVTASVLALSAMPSVARAAAEPQANSANPSIEEITVTARRVSERLQDVPVAVTALNAEALERKNVTATNDLQFSVPNLQIKPSNTYPSQPEFVLRGQRQVLLTDENVVTYFNGVAQSTRGLQFYDLENVQALKGPQGTLFGKNSMGGAMLINSRKPIFDAEGSLTGEFGNYNRHVVTAMMNIPLATDKVALRAVGQIERQDGFFKNLRPGGRDLNDRHNESGRVSLLIRPTESFENLTVFDYEHRDETPIPSLIEAAPLAGNFFQSVTQQAVTQQSALGGGTPLVDTVHNVLVRQGNPFVSTALTGFDGRITSGCASATGTCQVHSGYASRSEVYGVSNVSTLEVSNAISLKNIIGARYIKAVDYQDPSGITGMNFDYAGLFGTPPGAFVGPATNNDTYYRNVYKSFSNEFQIIGNLDNLKFIAGGYYSHNTQRYDVNSTFVVGGVSFYGPYPTRHSNDEAKSDSYAAFAQGTYDFSGIGLNGLKLTAGLRYTVEKKSHVTENFYSLTEEDVQNWDPSRPQSTCNELNAAQGNAVAINNGTLCQLSASRKFKALTWTASLEYSPNKDTLIYLATRRGYKAGGPNPTTRSLDYSIFGSEKITDLELGFKNEGRIGDVAYRFNVAGFIGKYKNIQTPDILQFCSNPAADPSNGPACGTYTDLIILNLGEATIKGVEVEATLKPVRQLQFDVGYSYQVGRYGKNSIVPQPLNPGLPVADSNPINFNGGIDLQGVEFAGIPRTNLTASATVFADFIPESFAKTTFNLNYYYRSSTKGLSVQGIYRTPSFSTLGARLAFDDIAGTDFSLAFWASNLTNKRYQLACSDNLNSIGFAACKWGDPRTYGVTASVKF